MGLFLGIDTSNYTTSTALFDDESGVMLQQKKLLPVKDGQLGLRQSDAVFHHTQQLSKLISELVNGVDASKISAIGVSTRPRPVEGSYMPCFTVGMSVAQSISSILKVPMFEFSHQEGHISSALFSACALDLFEKSFLAFHISGGTTEVVLAKGRGCGFSLDMVGKSLDLHAGQAVDRVGLMLGLNFPCGAELEKLALKCTDNFKVKPTVKGFDCCLSGVENQCKKLIDVGKNKEYVALYCIKYIEEALSVMTYRLLENYGSMPVIFAGGVMSNSIIKNSLTKKYNAIFAKPEFSTDNAAGIAYLAYRKFKNVYT